MAPVAFFLGMPFPRGIHSLERVSETGIPWMWGVNGGVTVMGSVLAVLLAMATSFTVVLLAAAAAYAIATLAYFAATRSSIASTPSAARS